MYTLLLQLLSNSESMYNFLYDCGEAILDLINAIEFESHPYSDNDDQYDYLRSLYSLINDIMYVFQD